MLGDLMCRYRDIRTGPVNDPNSEFHRLFHDTYIGSKLPSSACTSFVMEISFDHIDVSSMESINKTVNETIVTSVKACWEKYEHELGSLTPDIINATS
jgi:hypothetical protein